MGFTVDTCKISSSSSTVYSCCCCCCCRTAITRSLHKERGSTTRASAWPESCFFTSLCCKQEKPSRGRSTFSSTFFSSLFLMQASLLYHCTSTAGICEHVRSFILICVTTRQSQVGRELSGLFVYFSTK